MSFKSPVDEGDEDEDVSTLNTEIGILAEQNISIIRALLYWNVSIVWALCSTYLLY